MSLEEKVAYWVNLGTTNYELTYRLMEKLAKARASGFETDIILVTQHNPEVNFGSDTKNNRLSARFLREIENEFGENYTEENIREVLRRKGMNLSKTSRGGGATVLAPGQLVYHPIVDFKAVVGGEDIGAYKGKMYSIIFEALSALGISGIRIGSDDAYRTRKERRDAWIEREGKAIKLASKGLHFSRNIAYHGFALYIDQRGIEQFWLVDPCGYKEDEVEIGSVEAELGKPINHVEVNAIVKDLFVKHFGYTQIRDMKKEDVEKIAEKSKSYVTA